MRRFLGYGEIQLLNWRNRHALGIFYWMEETNEKPERIYF
jgi:hypothetical protein